MTFGSLSGQWPSLDKWQQKLPLFLSGLKQAVVVRFGWSQVCQACNDIKGDVFSQFHLTRGLMTTNLAPKKPQKA